MAEPSVSVWRYRDFRLVAVGQGLSWLGDSFSPIALTAAVVLGGGSTTDVGLAVGALMAGRLAFLLIGGVWGDRRSPVATMVSADLVRCLTAVVLALSLRGGLPDGAVLPILMFATGGAAAFFEPAMSSLKPLLVPDVLRQRANGTLASLQTAAKLVGPVLGGLLVTIAGSSVGFAANAMTYLLSAGCVLGVAVRPGERAGNERWREAIVLGWRAIRARSWLSATIGGACIYHVGNGAVLVLVQVVAMRDLGGAAALGWVISATGAGGLLGTLAASRMVPRRPLLWGSVALSATPLGVLTVARPEALPVVILGLSCGFAGLGFFSVLYETTLQREIPHEQLARVVSWDMLASFAVIPLGSAAAGPLTDMIGTTRAVVGCVLVMLAGVAVMLAVPSVRALRTPQESPPTPAGEMPTVLGAAERHRADPPVG